MESVAGSQGSGAAKDGSRRGDSASLVGLRWIEFVRSLAAGRLNSRSSGFAASFVDGQSDVKPFDLRSMFPKFCEICRELLVAAGSGRFESDAVEHCSVSCSVWISTISGFRFDPVV